MKNLILLITLSIATLPLNSQSNLNFENWITDQQGIETPVNWKSNNRSNYVSVKKSNIAVSGNYSVSMESNGISFEGKAPGVLSTTWSGMSTPIESVQFNINIDSISNGGKAQLLFKSYKNGSLISSDSAFFTSTTNGWINEVIVLSNQSVISDSIQVLISAKSKATPTGYVGYSSFLIDNIVIKKSLNVSDFDFNKVSIQLYPNPTTHKINFTLKDNSNFLKLEIYDVAGKKVKTEEYIDQENGEFNDSIDVSALKNGLYFCKFTMGNKHVTRKFIKE